MSLSTYYLEDGRYLARLHRRRRRRAYAPTSNTASHDNHEKIISWVSFSFLYGYGAPIKTCRLTHIKKKKVFEKVETALLATPNFMIINNSFSVKLCPQNAWNRIFGNVQFQTKFSGWVYPQTHLGWLVPSGELGLASINAACYAVLDACENSAKNSVSRTHGSRDCIMAASIH